MKHILKIVFIIFILVAITIVFLSKQEYTKIDSNELALYSSDYTLTSHQQTDYELYSIYYPPVSMNPQSTKYFLLSFYEKYQIITDQNDELFFASKRINEIDTWTDTLFIHENIKTFPELKRWWHTLNYSSIFFSNKYSSWESILARYSNLLDDYIIKVTKIQSDNIRKDETEELKKHIYQHNIKLDQIITNSEIDSKKKKYLHNLRSAIYRYYAQKLQIQNNTNSDKWVYSLSQIKKNEDFGTYRILIDYADVPFYEDTRISIESNSYMPILHKIDNFKGFVSFEDIKISDDTPSELHLSQGEIINLIQFLQVPLFNNETTKTNENEVPFYSDITHLVPFGSSELRIFDSTDNDMPVTLYIVSKPIRSPFDLNDIVTDETTQSVSTQEEGIIPIQRNYLEKDKHIILVVQRSLPAAENMLNASMGIVHEQPPKLFMKKISHQEPAAIEYQQSGDEYTVKLSHVSSGQVNQFFSLQSSSYNLVKNSKLGVGTYEVIFKPALPIWSTALFLIGVIGLIFSSIQRNHTFSMLRDLLSKTLIVSLSLMSRVARPILRLVGSYALLLLTVSILFILFEIFILKRAIDIIDISICFVLFTISISRNWSKLFVHFALAFFIFSLILYVLGKEQYRLVADWVFLFLIFIIIRLSIEKN